MLLKINDLSRLDQEMQMRLECVYFVEHLAYFITRNNVYYLSIVLTMSSSCDQHLFLIRETILKNKHFM